MEKKYPWVVRASESSEEAFCKLCKTSLAPKLCRLTEHDQSVAHLKRVRASSNCRKLPFQVMRTTCNDELKLAELELAVTMACHCSISSIDHIVEFTKKRASEGSLLKKLRIHRTKCSLLLSKVVSPAMYQDFVNDARGQYFSVLVDESTDVASEKHICIVIRYFSEKRSKIVTELGGLVTITGASGEELFEALNACVSKLGLQWSDCIGFGSDGASSMIGEHNSVWSRVRERSPHCQLNRCICHSLALCVEKAYEKLPSCLGHLLHEIPAWFRKSMLRRRSFENLFKIMDPNQERKGTPLPFQKMSRTRWLVRGKIIYDILVNWEELKAYFTVVMHDADASCRYRAREIQAMVADRKNLLYFHFLCPIVRDFESLNSRFQSTDVDPELLVKELLIFFKSFQNRIQTVDGQPLEMKHIDFGFKFSVEMQDYLETMNRSADALHIAEELKDRCKSFLDEAFRQLQNRLPPSLTIFKGLSSFAPSRVLSQTGRVPYKDLPFPHLRTKNGDELERQYRNLLHVSWTEESIFGGKIPDDTMEFWTGVLQYEGLGKITPFKELSVYVMACLTTPVSNAVVERIFSQVTIVKSKLRNRMKNETLDAIIRIRNHLHMDAKCCKDFVVSPRMLELFTSDVLYGEDSEGEEILEYANLI